MTLISRWGTVSRWTMIWAVIIFRLWWFICISKCHAGLFLNPWHFRDFDFYVADSLASFFSSFPFSFVWENCDKTHKEGRPARIPDEQSAQRLPSLLLWHWGLQARPSKCWRHLHLCALQQARRGGMDGEGRVIGLPAPLSLWHIMKIKVPEGLNYHIHLNRALSHVVIERNPNQQCSLWL